MSPVFRLWGTPFGFAAGSHTRLLRRTLARVIATLVTFRHTDATWDRARLEAISHSTAPKYKGKPGLVMKTYWYDDARMEHGGFYVWESREFAEATHTDEHCERLAFLYGVMPTVRYLDAPVFVDNT